MPVLEVLAGGKRPHELWYLWDPIAWDASARPWELGEHPSVVGLHQSWTPS